MTEKDIIKALRSIAELIDNPDDNVVLKIFKGHVINAADTIESLQSQLTERDKEIERMREYRTPQKTEPGEDRPFCPRCHEEIVGYYASYCEYCGQALDRGTEEDYV